MPEEAIKCKIISFRVSDHDYEAVEAASRKGGFTSVSLFARAATLAFNSSEFLLSPLDVEINRLWRRIEALTTTLEQIANQQNAALDLYKTG